MAGLLDFLSPPGSGLFGNVGGYLNNNQDALIALGLGLAGGNTVSDGLRGGMQGFLQGRKSDQQRVAGEGFLKELGLGVAPSAPMSKPSPALPQQQPANFGNAIAGIESGGRYDAMGPVIPKTGDRAYGKYQVMGANIPAWTEQFAGQRMTPEQFIASPQAQDAVFSGQFGQYAQKYGPEGAARAWFAGEKGMHNPNARDVLGTTVQQYGQKFAQAIGPQTAAPQATVPPRTVAPDQLGAIRNLPIETVMRWAMNPNLPENMAGVAKEIFKARLEDTKMTEAQKDYMRAKVDGYQGSFADWKNNPSFGETGQRDEYGRPIQGWRNPNTMKVTGANGEAITPTPSKTPPELVTELRKEVQQLPSYKNITQAAPVYKSMLDAAGRDNRAADVNMIYGLAKIMDPTSVVRESEMTIAQAVATLPQQLQANIMSQLQSTGRLSPDVRAAIMQEAHSRVSAYKGMFDQDTGMYRGILQRQKMNEADVLPNFGEFEQFKPKRAEAPGPQEGQTATHPQTGARIILKGGKWVPLTGPQT